MRLHETVDFRSKATLINFIEWWKDRAPNSPGQCNIDINDKEFMSRIHVNSQGEIDTSWKITIEDNKSTFLPFKFGRVSGLRLFMENLQSSENFPSECGSFEIGYRDRQHINHWIDSLNNIPDKCTHIVLAVERPWHTFATRNGVHCNSLWLDCPYVESFAGFNGSCSTLGLILRTAGTLNDIRKLRNVKNLSLQLPKDFSGGLLGIAMIPGLQKVSADGPDSGSFNKPRYIDAINFMNDCIGKRMNVHDIQEEMIEGGFAKFARP